MQKGSKNSLELSDKIKPGEFLPQGTQSAPAVSHANMTSSHVSQKQVSGYSSEDVWFSVEPSMSHNKLQVCSVVTVCVPWILFLR